MQYLDLAATTYALHPVPFLIIAAAFALNFVLMLIIAYRTLRLIPRGFRAIKRKRRLAIAQRQALARMRTLPTVHGYQRPAN